MWSYFGGGSGPSLNSPLRTVWFNRRFTWPALSRRDGGGASPVSCRRQRGLREGLGCQFHGEAQTGACVARVTLAARAVWDAEKTTP